MNDLICVSHLRWGFVWQRPQHLLSRLGAKRQVLFVEEPVASPQLDSPQLEFQQHQHNRGKVTVVRLRFPMPSERWIGHGDRATQQVYSALLADYLDAENYQSPILWLYTPMALDFVQAIPHSLLVFDVMDQLSAFKGAPAELIDHERRLLKQADVVFTGGVSLYRDKLPLNPHTYLFPSGVDSKHFKQASAPSKLPIPHDMAKIPAPRLGYSGVIDERMDLSLLRYLASMHPEWHFILIGPVVKIDSAELPQAANIHYLGMKTYDELPAYLALFDVALIPFAQNESTRFISPTKTLEYLAARKPVISTPIHDVVELYGEVVRIGRDAEEYERQIQAALNREGVDIQRRIDALLAIYSWDRIAKRMSHIINVQLSARAAARKLTVQATNKNVRPDSASAGAVSGR